MLDGDRLRLRILTILGAGLLATGPGCGGRAESTTADGPGSQVDRAAGSGGTTGGGSAGQFAAAGSGGGSAGQFAAGGNGPACFDGQACFTYAQLLERVGASDLNAIGEGGAPGLEAVSDIGGANEAGSANEAGAPASIPRVACPKASIPGLLSSGETALSERATVEGNACCYQVTACHSGRPFTVNDEARTAPAALRGDWNDAFEQTRAILQTPIATEARALLVTAWLEDALAEHASIASFARLTLELLQHAAPADLVMQSQLASLDEVEHARLCFAQAARYGHVDRGPGRLSMEAALGPIDLPRLAASTVLEGCIGETLAALIAVEQAHGASDPRTRAVLQKIAEDEARHAEFAWQVVRWALSVGGRETREAVALAFERSNADFSHPPAPERSPYAEVLRAHGRLSDSERAEVLERGLREVVLPCARALLSSSAEQSAAGDRVHVA